MLGPDLVAGCHELAAHATAAGVDAETRVQAWPWPRPMDPLTWAFSAYWLCEAFGEVDALSFKAGERWAEMLGEGDHQVVVQVAVEVKQSWAWLYDNYVWWGKEQVRYAQAGLSELDAGWREYRSTWAGLENLLWAASTVARTLSHQGAA